METGAGGSGVPPGKPRWNEAAGARRGGGAGRRRGGECRPGHAGRRHDAPAPSVPRDLRDAGPPTRVLGQPLPDIPRRRDAAPLCATKAVSPAKRRRFRAAELRAAPPAAAHSHPAGQLLPQRSQEHHPSCSPPPPLSQQASSPTNRRKLGLIRPPALATSLLAPWYLFPPARRRGITVYDVLVHRGRGRFPFPCSNSPAGRCTA